VRAVNNTGPGNALVTLSFDACEDFPVAPATFELPVVAPPAAAKK
jgi:hypothetical protein